VGVSSDFATHPWLPGVDGVLDLWCEGRIRGGSIDPVRSTGRDEMVTPPQVGGFGLVDAQGGP
jgi:hypothetical protein